MITKIYDTNEWLAFVGWNTTTEDNNYMELDLDSQVLQFLHKCKYEQIVPILRAIKDLNEIGIEVKWLWNLVRNDAILILEAQEKELIDFLTTAESEQEVANIQGAIVNLREQIDFNK